MGKLTYEDKEQLNVNGEIPNKYKVMATDLNEIKSVVNENDTNALYNTNVKTAKTDSDTDVYSCNYVNGLLNLLCPIGRGFIDFTDTDYSNYLGFTWERELVGMTAVGLDTTQTEFNSVGKVGGEKTHILTINEMPNHTHSLYYYGTEGTYNPPYTAKVENSTSGEASYGTNVNTTYTGNNQSHNNLQPYKVVAYWKRIA